MPNEAVPTPLKVFSMVTELREQVDFCLMTAAVSKEMTGEVIVPDEPDFNDAIVRSINTLKLGHATLANGSIKVILTPAGLQRALDATRGAISKSMANQLVAGLTDQLGPIEGELN